MKFTEYQVQVITDVQDTVRRLSCQPVLFLGAGISRRYFNAPGWDELLERCIDECPAFDRPFAYYKQRADNNLELASMMVEGYSEWAWSGNSNQFPSSTLTADKHRDFYLKRYISDLLDDATPGKFRDLDEKLQQEISALSDIRPHSIITTNYDQFLEKVFPDYQRIIGPNLLSSEAFMIGEIFKIHGCSSEPESLVLTSEDYEGFEDRKKFLAAKLLNLFREHPLLIVGYGVSDYNVQEFFADIDLALGLPGELLENVYYVEFTPGVSEKATFQTEKLIQVSAERSVRVKLIQADDYEWVYKAFKSPDLMPPVSSKVLRAIMARAKHLVRVDIPRNKVEADFKLLEDQVSSQENFSSMFGVVTVDASTALSATHPWPASELASQMGFGHWTKPYQLIKKIKDDTGIDIRSFDNKYHRVQKYGSSNLHYFSPAAKSLLEKVSAEGLCDEDWLDIS